MLVLLQKIGDSWITNLDLLQSLKQYANNDVFLDSLARVKQENKLRVAQYVSEEYNIEINPASLFDIHVCYKILVIFWVDIEILFLWEMDQN